MIEQLAPLNALLNGISAILLFLGYRAIKAGKWDLHKKYMVAALIMTVLFLSSYFIYHYHVGSMPYKYNDWTRILYYAILIPHVILAAINLPLIIRMVIFAFKGTVNKHKKLARFVLPVWFYVSTTGVIIYIMLYQL